MDKTGIESYYILHNGRRLKFGYTTGTCAAAASKAAMISLLTGTAPARVDILTPKGISLSLPVLHHIKNDDGSVSCAIKKYSGDDPDVTDGAEIWAKVSLREDDEINIDGGVGVGRVTKAGLSLKIGEAAINRVPREMIKREVRELLEIYDLGCGADVLIFVPNGEEFAKRTFNPRLGIEGGISILGTSGIVEPMSENALIESIRTEIRQKRALGENRIILTPGNYGADYLKKLTSHEPVRFGNYLGIAIDIAADEGFNEIIVVSHIGKIIKAAGGIMNTHSRMADARADIMASCALMAGCDADTARRILECVTTDEMLNVLMKCGFLGRTMKVAGRRILENLKRRMKEQTKFRLIVFSNEKGTLFDSDEYIDERFRIRRV